MINLRISLLALTLVTASTGLAHAQTFTLGGLLGLSEDSQYRIGGHTAVGYITNNTPLSQAPDDLLAFGDWPKKVTLNQQWLFVERVASSDGEWGIGGRFDVMYGADAQKLQSFGNPRAGVRKGGRFDAGFDYKNYGIAIPQLYLEVANDELSVKAGHFATPMGYETLPVTGNFFMSHSYTGFNSEPFTHTGALATYSGLENFTFYAGYTLGWDTGFEQLNGGSNWLGGVSASLTDDVALTYLNTYGTFGWRDGGGTSDSYAHSIVLTANINDQLQYVGQSDMIRITNRPTSEYDTVGLNQYLFYQLNDMARLGIRGEWWKADGINFYQGAIGVNLSPFPNLVIRPEYSYHQSNDIGLDEGSFGIDAILRY